MNERHLARMISLQALYQLDFANLLEQNKKESQEKIERLLKYNFKEFSSPSFKYEGFARELIFKIIEKLDELNQWIKDFALEWPIKQISLIDRNVLRIGIFELLYLKETPPKVAIDEAIELAKNFGSETSGRFVNGVLGAIYEKIKKSNNEKDKKK